MRVPVQPSGSQTTYGASAIGAFAPPETAAAGVAATAIASAPRQREARFARASAERSPVGDPGSKLDDGEEDERRNEEHVSEDVRTRTMLPDIVCGIFHG
jgi:hypothetical protein